MKSRATLMTVCVVLLSSWLYASDADSSQWVLKTAEDAKNVSLMQTGFSRLAEYYTDTNHSRIVVLNDDKIPFLNLNGKSLWETTVDVKLEMRIVNDDTGEEVIKQEDLVRRFNLYTDPETGMVVKAVSGDHLIYPHKPPFPSPDTAEWVMRHRGETYHGFPSEPPAVDMVEAMRFSTINPMIAKEIHVYYLHWSNLRHEARNVWLFDFRGIDPPWPVREGADVPVEQRNHFRVVVDAVEGYHLTSTIGPHGGGLHREFDQEELEAMRKAGKQ